MHHFIEHLTRSLKNFSLALLERLAVRTRAASVVCGTGPPVRGLGAHRPATCGLRLGSERPTVGPRRYGVEQSCALAPTKAVSILCSERFQFYAMSDFNLCSEVVSVS
jgi:hypothetical protein